MRISALRFNGKAVTSLRRGGNVLWQVGDIVYPVLQATGLAELTITEGESQVDWLGFSTTDGEGETLEGLFSGGDPATRQITKVTNADPRVTVVNNNPRADFSSGGFVVTETFEASDGVNPPVTTEVLITVREDLALAFDDDVIIFQNNLGDNAITFGFQTGHPYGVGPWTIDPNDFENSVPQIVVYPKLAASEGADSLPGLWGNDPETNGPLSLSIQHLDSEGQPIGAAGLTRPAGAVDVEVTATNSVGTTVIRASDLA